jgi:hypothetical protein
MALLKKAFLTTKGTKDTKKTQAGLEIIRRGPQKKSFVKLHLKILCALCVLGGFFSRVKATLPRIDHSRGSRHLHSRDLVHTAAGFRADPENPRQFRRGVGAAQKQ